MALSACSVFKKGTRSEAPFRNNSSVNLNLAAVGELNLSSSGFFISKAEVEISGKDIDQNILCTVKFTPPESYLISLRSRTGIEAARLFVSGDTVLMNDRINRRLYYGSNEKLAEKYGFSYSTIALIFGDYLQSEQVNPAPVTCDEGLLRKRNMVERTMVEYTIDCKLAKTIFASAGRKNELNLRYSDFKKYDRIVIPERVEIEDKSRQIKILLTIMKIEFPWEGSIEFIPGSGYEKIPLL